MAQNCAKPLIRWMEEGDPDLVPVLMSDGWSTTASYYGLPGRGSAVTTDMVLQCHRETGMFCLGDLGKPLYTDYIQFLDNFSVRVREERTAEALLRHTTIATPVGELTETYITPDNLPACWVKHYVEDESDLPPVVCFIEAAAQAIMQDDRVRKSIADRFKAQAAQWPSDVPLFALVGIPAFRFMSNEWINPPNAFYILADHRSVLERLFEAEMQTLPIILDCAADAGADFVFHAINGLELYSMSIYEDYFIPQARALHDMVHERGMKGWVHTCGYLRQLIELGAHHKMKVDVLESLSHPPLGDVGDLKDSRNRLGKGMATRGAVNVSLFYEDDADEVRRRTRLVLDETRGSRHMIGDTNGSYPPYSRENILAMVDEVRKSGRMLSNG